MDQNSWEYPSENSDLSTGQIAKIKKKELSRKKLITSFEKDLSKVILNLFLLSARLHQVLLQQ